nr:MAG TPA: hypothetical protein [Caudoviricetes sp.]
MFWYFVFKIFFNKFNFFFSKMSHINNILNYSLNWE